MSKTFFTRITVCLLLLCAIITPVSAYAITYYVKFNANGGSGTMSNQSFTTDEEKYLSTNTFTRTGYNFIGWNSNSGGTGTWYMPSKKVKNLTTTSGATVDVYAQWMQSNQSTIKIGTTEVTKDSGGNYNIDNHKNYTVQVNVVNGTVNISSKSVEYYTDATFTVTAGTGANNPTVSCTNSQSGSLSGNTLTVASVSNNTVCTVTYQMIPYTLTANANGGAINDYSGWSLSTNNIYVQSVFDFGDKYFDIRTPISSNSSYTVTYLCGDESTVYTDSWNNSLLQFLCNHHDANKLVITGLSIDGTVFNVNQTFLFDAAGSSSNDFNSGTNQYIISNAAVSKSITYGSTYGTLPTPIREGYSFEGWYTTSTGGTQINSSDIYNQTKNSTIYAHWDCMGLPSQDYNTGDIVTYAGLNWTVVNNNSSSVDLAYNGYVDNSGSASGLSPGSFDNASAAVSSWLNSNIVTKAAMAKGCLVNNGSSSNSKVNAPNSYYWLKSGEVNIPEKIDQYTLSSSYFYGGYIRTVDPTSDQLRSSINATANATTIYNSGDTASLSNDESTITFSNAVVNSTNTSNYYSSKGYTLIDPVNGADYSSEYTANNSADRMITKVRYRQRNGTETDNSPVIFQNTKIYVIKVCGGSYHGQNYRLQAVSYSQYKHKAPSADDYTTSNYSDADHDYRFKFAGRTGSTTTGSSPSFTRTWNISSDGGCNLVSKKSLASKTVNIYYRPYINVVKR